MRYGLKFDMDCLVCTPGYSHAYDGPKKNDCVKGMEGCFAIDQNPKKCQICLYGWYMNSDFRCVKSKFFIG